MKNSALESILGFLVLCVAAYFIFFAYNNIKASNDSQNGYKVFARFRSTGGIEDGAPIKLSGIKVGYVVSQKIDPSTYQAVLTFKINSRIRIPEDSQAEILSDGLLGERYIRLTPGQSKKHMKPGETFLFVKNFISFEEMLSRFIFLSNS